MPQKRYFEDFEPGQVYDLGRMSVSREEIITFARQFDPQPFHIDEEAAKDSIYGGLIASGWHSMSILMRLLVDNLLNDSASLGSPGVDELRWLKPVRPDDTLNARGTILDVIPSRSKPDRGIVKSSYEMLNQRGALVMTVKSMGLFGRRPA